MSTSSNSKKTSSPSLIDTSSCLNDSKNPDFNDTNDSLQNKSLLETVFASPSNKIDIPSQKDENTNVIESKLPQRQVLSGKK
jgi:hypothetical protein